MGTLLRVIVAFAIAYAVYDPHAFAAYFDTHGMTAAKAELAATRPGAEVRLVIEQGLKHLRAGRAD